MKGRAGGKERSPKRHRRRKKAALLLEASNQGEEMKKRKGSRSGRVSHFSGGSKKEIQFGKRSSGIKHINLYLNSTKEGYG